MTDEDKTIRLNQSVISDTEAQFAGDVETPFVELVSQAVAPASTTDKASSLIYSMAADDSVRIKSQAGVELNLTDRLLNPVGAFPFHGNIAAAAQFPLPAANPAGVENGWTFLCTADVTDNDATRTNTLQAFLAGAVISWNGVNWTQTGQAAYRQYALASPVAVGEGEFVVIEVPTVDLGGGCVINMPAITADLIGKKVLVVDVQSNAGTFNIAVIPNGGDLINGVNAPWNLTENDSVALFEVRQIGAAAFGWVVTVGGADLVLNQVHRLGDGEDHATVAEYRDGLLPAHAAADHTVPYVPLAADVVIGATSAGGAVAINLNTLATYADDKVLIVKDEGGNAGVANITVTPNGAELIDGVNAPVLINVAYGVLRLYKRPGGWFTW
jgi:hypothetical protein